MTENVDKSSYMKKEIFEQPEVAQRLFWLNFDCLPQVEKIVFVASGSSYNCADIVSTLLDKIGGIDSESFYSGEFQMPDDYEKTLFVFVSQSGKTADTLAALKFAAKYTDNILAVSNNATSEFAVYSKFFVPTEAGEEKSVAATKTVCAQLTVLLRLAAYYSKNPDLTEFFAKAELPKFLTEILAHSDLIKPAAEKFADGKPVQILATKEFLPVASEAALKISETSYIFASAVPAGEFLHGHCAVLNNPGRVLVFVDEKNRRFVFHTLERIKQNFSTEIIVFTRKSFEKEVLPFCNEVVTFPDCDGISQIYGFLLLSQLTALFCAEKSGKNVDKPAGITKTVNN